MAICVGYSLSRLLKYRAPIPCQLPRWLILASQFIDLV